jgi:WD40 repeat protein
MAEPSSPPSIPDYELLRLIGSGAYGEVWLARSVTGAFRAVKVIYRGRFEDDRPLEREFRGIQRFEPISRMHSSQVAILHVGRTEEYFYYVMELADDASAESGAAPVQARADSLSNRESPATSPSPSERTDRTFTGAATYKPRTVKSELQMRGRLPVEECVRVSLLLTTALEHLHQHGLIHRDIKPSNIIFAGGVPKLADIGLVASMDATRSYVGTEGFVPPEGPGTPQADIYSLGKVLYEICTGRDRQDFPELPTQLRQEQDREALVELNEIVLKACEHNPASRYRSAEEMHADLALLQAGKSVRRARGLEKRLTQAKRWAIAAGLLALLGMGVTYQSKRAEKLALAQVHRLHVAQGVRLLNDGDSYGAALWFAKALNLGYHDPVQEQVNRLRIGTALRFSPALSQIILHSDMIRRAVFSPDGERIATASADRTARIWDAASGEPITARLEHRDEVRDVEFSPDSRWVITASNDHTARIWDAATGQPISPPLKHDSYVYRATFHPNGSLVATASEDRTARIWNAYTGALIGSPLKHDDRLSCVRFSNDGRWLATASRDGMARIWRIADNELLGGARVLSGSVAITTGHPAAILRHAGEVREIAFSSDSRHIATASDDRTARVWDVATGEALTPPFKHGDQIWCVAFSPDGRLVATGGKDRAARIWNSSTGEAVAPPLQHANNLRAIAFSPDGRWLATASSDHTARIWQVSDGTPVAPSLNHASNLEGAVFDRAGSRLLTASRDGSARIWDLSSLNSSELRLTNESPVDQVAASSDAKYILVRPIDMGTGKPVPAYQEKPAYLWNLQTPVPTITPLSVTYSIGFSPDDGFAVTSSRGLQLWEPSTGRKLEHVRASANPNETAVSMAFSPDGRWLAEGTSVSQESGECPGEIRLWETGKFVLSGSIPLSNQVNRVAFSPNGRTLVGCWFSILKDYGGARVWDVATFRPLGPPMHFPGKVTQAAFSPDGQRLVIAFTNETLGPCEAGVWNPYTGQMTAPPIKHRDGVSAASFSPDGNWIVTASEDKTARVWNSRTSEPRTPPLQHDAQVQWAEFSPDGMLVLTASMDGTACVWDASTGQPVISPLQHQGPVRHAIFSKDGRFVITASEDRTARVWKLSRDDRPPAELLRLAELLAARKIDATGGLVPLETDEIREMWKAQH